MTRHEFLRELHKLVRPATYLEIGVNDGRSLALSRVPSIAVDPAFKVTVALRCDLDLVKATSDDFFALPDPLAHFRGRAGRATTSDGLEGASDERPEVPRVDLAFIDGMHLFEFALRDFMNLERHADWWSVVVFDDMLPRDIDEAARDRHTVEWAGDVYKMIPILQRHRPDLTVIPVNTAPTGVMVVLGSDRANDALRHHYDQIVAEWSTSDPQLVPTEILTRSAAVEPAALLASPLWDGLARARRQGVPAQNGRDSMRELTAAIPRLAGRGPAG